MKNMEDKYKILADAVKKFPILYDSADPCFRKEDRKNDVWQDVAVATGYPDGKAAKLAFRNLRERYGREIKKIRNTNNKNGETESKAARIPDQYLHLSWLDKVIRTRSGDKRKSNLPEIGNTKEGLVEKTEDGGMMVTFESSVIQKDVLDSMSSSGCEDNVSTNPSLITTAVYPAQEPRHHQIVYQDIAPQQSCDEEKMYCDLLTTKLKKLSDGSRFHAMHEIDLVMYKYRSLDTRLAQNTNSLVAKTPSTVHQAKHHSTRATSSLNDTKRNLYQFNEMCDLIEKSQLTKFRESILHNPEKVHARGKDGQSLLHAAATCDRFSLVEFLIAQGCDTKQRDKDGSTAYLYAVIYNSADLLRELCKCDNDNNNVNIGKDDNDDQNGCTPLHYAASSNKHGLIKILLSHPHINVDAKDSDGYAPDDHLDCCDETKEIIGDFRSLKKEQSS